MKQVSDGSSLAGLQVVVNAGVGGHQDLAEGRITTGAAVVAKGELVKSPGGKQSVRGLVTSSALSCPLSLPIAEGLRAVQIELKAERVQLIGGCDAENYPLQKKRHTLEFLRGIAHLRPRTNTVRTPPPVPPAAALLWTHVVLQRR